MGAGGFAVSSVRIPLRTILSALVVTGLACADSPTISQIEERASLAGSGHETRVTGPLISLDEHFAALADSAPGFAGIYYDRRGVLVVRRTAVGSLVAIRNVLQTDATGIVPLRARSDIGGNVRQEAADYDSRQLLSWKKLIYQMVPLRGVVFVDLDEVKNRIHIGTRSNEGHAVLMGAITSVGVPAAAIFLSHGYVPQRQQSLSDRFRPIPGGVRVVVEGSAACTLTANVRVSGEDYFLTSSHCSFRFGDGGDGSEVEQDDDLIGQEVADPYLISPGGTCPEEVWNEDLSQWVQIEGCRYSDAALFVYSSTSLSQDGTIARTTSSNGSTTVSGSTPRFFVTGASWSYPLVGTVVHKVGFATGWTTAEVECGADWEAEEDCDGNPRVGNTCIDFFPDQFGSLCQAVAPLGSGAGDSGSPIFMWSGTGGDIELVGILVGGLGGGRTVFSPWLYVSLEVEGDFGPWELDY